MCRLWAVTNLVRKDVRFAECVYKSRAAGARSACDGQHCYRVQLLLNSLTDDHNSELNALDLVSPPSSDRHFGGDGSGTEYVWGVVRYRPLFMEWCEFINAASHE